MPPSPSAVPGSSHRRGTVHESDPDVVGDDATAAKEPESFVSLFEANVEKLGGQRLYTWHSSAECTGDIVWSYTELAQRGRAVCCALRRRWEVGDGARVMLIYPPGLDFLVAFFGCQYAAVIAVPYYPPIIPASPMPSAGAKKMLADGLAKVVRIYSSCHPELLLSTTMYLRLKWLSSKLLGGDCSWPSSWNWRSTDDLSTRLPPKEAAWLEGWLRQRREPASPDEIAFLQFTSGSTGHPKGWRAVCRRRGRRELLDRRR